MAREERCWPSYSIARQAASHHYKPGAPSTSVEYASDTPEFLVLDTLYFDLEINPSAYQSLFFLLFHLLEYRLDFRLSNVDIF